ncbi:hypothetical protein F4810DRAFT_502289 [Camillea tinctor]|nr:hypothetical protein F4810DRAFT_502289 [Camillea tinctor]
MAPSPKQLRKVALAGATGTVGAPILKALLEAGHTVTVLTRSTSTSALPSGVPVQRGSYEDESFAASALAGHDVLVLALNHTAYAAQAPLIRAAAKAGVRYVVPCEFGSDLAHEKLRSELLVVGEALRDVGVDLVKAKEPYRALAEELGVAWLGVTTGPWVELTMRLGGYGVNVTKRAAALLDGGKTRASITTLTRVGESLAALLALPEGELATYGNGWVYFSSFTVSQRELLDSAIRATGTREEDWNVVDENSDGVVAKCKEGLAKKDIMSGLRLLTTLSFKEGYGGDFSAKVVDNKKLGLEPESLDEVMKGVVAGFNASA